MTKARVLAEGLYFGEGPRWRDGRLWFSDFYDHAVKSIDMNGSTRTEFEIDDQPSGLGWLPDGRLLVVAMHRKQVLRVDRTFGLVCPLDELPATATFYPLRVGEWIEAGVSRLSLLYVLRERVGSAILSRLIPDFQSEMQRINDEARESAGQHAAVAKPRTYAALTDGSYRPLHDELLITVSSRAEETVPNLPHAPSPFLEDLSGRVLLDVWGGSFDHDAEWLRETAHHIKDQGVALGLAGRRGLFVVGLRLGTGDRLGRRCLLGRARGRRTASPGGRPCTPSGTPG